MEEERIVHEAFGQVSISRVSCSGNVPFYGSELPQNHYIQLEICPSELNRNLTDDRYHAGYNPIIKVRMSASQFSEMITSLNMGGGTCCTIESIQGKRVKELPKLESRKEFVHKKFDQRMKMFADSIRGKQQEAKNLVKKKTLSNEDMRQLQNHLDWMTGEIEKNIPYFAKCFQETMDDVVFEAKLEVENAIQHKLNVLGLQSLKEITNSKEEPPKRRRLS